MWNSRRPGIAPPTLPRLSSISPMLLLLTALVALGGGASAAAQGLDVVVVRNTESTTNSPFARCPAGRVAIGGGCSDDFTSTRLRSAFPITRPPFGFEGFACVFEKNPGSLSAFAVCLLDPGDIGLCRVRNTVSSTNSPQAVCPMGTQVIGGGCSDDFTSTFLRTTRPTQNPPFLNEGWFCSFESNPGLVSAFASCIDDSVDIGLVEVSTTSTTTNAPQAICPMGKEILAGGCSDDFTSTRLQSTFPTTSPPFLNEGWACNWETNPGSLTAVALCQD